MKAIIPFLAAACFFVGQGLPPAGWDFPGAAMAASCDSAVRELGGKLQLKIDEVELVELLRSLNRSGNRKLPAKFVTKKEANAAGWRPGLNLWAVAELRGKSLGGDRFGNYEKRLPNGQRKWREADLDYQGGRRGPKRLVFSTDGLRVVTVDHYQSFREIPACQ